MPDYKYRAMLKDGKIIRGKMSAANKHQIIVKLKDARMQPLLVKKMKSLNLKKNRIFNKKRSDFLDSIKSKSISKVEFKPMTLKDLQNIEFHPFKRVKSKDIIAFVNNFYILKKADFNNIQALQSLYEGIDNPVFKDIVEDILIGVEAGERVSSVMANYPRIFPSMFVNFVRVGEDSGNMDTALLHARDYIEASTKLRKQIRASVIPRLLQFIGIMVGMFVALIVGVPMLKNIYEMFGSTKQLPAATLVAVNIAEWMLRNWYVIVSFILAGLLGFFLFLNTARGRYTWDRFLMKAPVIGNLIINITVSKFFQAMLLNLKNGMRIQEALEVSKDVTNNYYFLSLVEVAKSNSIIGSSWIQPFHDSNIFKPMVSQMITIGMETDLSEMMEKVNEYIKIEIDASISKFVRALPDITYLFVGIALIAFVLTVMVPLMEVYMGSFITAG